MKESNNRINDILINDKTLPSHNYLTLELVRQGLLKGSSEFNLYRFDYLFEQLLQSKYTFKQVLISTSYVVSRIKKHKYKDQYGKRIKSLYSYFRTSLTWNLKIINGEIDLGWLDSDDE